MGRRTLVIFMFVVAAALIVSQRIPSRVAYDQKLYHYPSIRMFAQTLPTIDPWDYLSATTPGYHVLYAAVYRLSGSVLALQVLSALVGLAWAAFAVTLASRTRQDIIAPQGLARWVPAVVCLPLVTSNYTLFPSVYLLPDTWGWLGVLAMVALGVRGRLTMFAVVAASVVLTALVLVRQIHIWAMAPWVVGVFVRAWEETTRRQAVRRAGTAALIALGACVPAVVALALFVRYWGGLVPPRFQGWYPPRTLVDMALSPSGAFYLAVTGAYACFFVPLLVGPLVAAWRKHRGWVIGAAAAGAVIALIPPTTYDYDAGRRSGLWNIAAQLPVVGRTSPFMVLGAMWGAVALAALLAGVPLRPRLVMLAAMGAYCAAMSASAETWQRYFDPMALLALGLLAAWAHAGREGPTRWWHLAGPLVLGGALLGQSLWMVVRADATTMDAPPPPAKSEQHQGGEPPVLFDAPVKPDGRRFWVW